MKSLNNLSILGLLVAATYCPAQQILSEIENIVPREIKVDGFNLEQDQQVEINGTGFRKGRKQSVAFTRAWVLNAATREVVWIDQEADMRDRGRRLVQFRDSITLDAGDYEVYYSSFPYHYYKTKDKEFWGLERFFDHLFDGDEEESYHTYKKEWKQFKIVVTGRGNRNSAERIVDVRNMFTKEALVSLLGSDNEAHVRQAFEVQRPLDIQIYALGEARKDGSFDYGWIINTDTRQRVWKFTYDDSDHAGGAKKNRLVDRTLFLPKGKYTAFYVTDDSHSPYRWNEAPPLDPAFWGLTIRTVDPEMRRFVRQTNVAEIDAENVILKLTRVRDNELRSKPITCKKNLAVRIYALGEGMDRKMFDYSWIIDSNTHKKVWQLDYRSTEHAGGASKNRLYDRVINLRKGNYVVYCVTDDNHSFSEWNEAPPYDQENWGITILAADSNYNSGDVIDQHLNSRTLAQIIRVGDDARERERFRLGKETEIRIYAIGEGTHGSMHDFAWIEDDETGDIVWEMQYRSTTAAGGSSKNRLIDQTMRLPSGDYLLYYESDDSHSFEEWNMSPPYDPEHWGVTIYEQE